MKILTEVDVDSVVSGRKGFTNINGSSREGNELKDVAHTSWKVLECVKRDDHLSIPTIISHGMV